MRSEKFAIFKPMIYNFLWNVSRSQLHDRSVSVPMTLRLKWPWKAERMGPVLSAELHTYAHTVWPTAITFGRQPLWGAACL